MPEKTVEDKVLCCIVRDGEPVVFRRTDHTYEEVGLQVPAGSIRSGETPEQAALHEFHRCVLLPAGHPKPPRSGSMHETGRPCGRTPNLFATSADVTG
ncbi:NUDIX domain-containing protein [Nocardiopsis tropica]|uniref:NUDIX domain-containing protein n=1 Tax=Nocardiopsis tropica TaxID=109330 RepID=UPI002E8B8701|nr:NUDIX domain-containing protein [Nocardiopsis tropica]